jgi:hypothetical protein
VRGFEAKTNDGLSPLTFEASIHYYHHKMARDNLHSILPCSRLIWILRNPLPRALSEYLHQAVKKKLYPSFKELISEEVSAIRRCKKDVGMDLEGGFDNMFFRCLSKSKLKKFMLSTAFYGYFINAWFQKFPRDQHLFVDYEKFKGSPQLTVKRVSEFLGISPPPLLNNTWIYNKANTNDSVAMKKRAQSKLSLSHRRQIQQEIAPFILKLFEIIQDDFKWTLDALR